MRTRRRNTNTRPPSVPIFSAPHHGHLLPVRIRVRERRRPGPTHGPGFGPDSSFALRFSSVSSKDPCLWVRRNWCIAQPLQLKSARRLDSSAFSRAVEEEGSNVDNFCQICEEESILDHSNQQFTASRTAYFIWTICCRLKLRFKPRCHSSSTMFVLQKYSYITQAPLCVSTPQKNKIDCRLTPLASQRLYL